MTRSLLTIGDRRDRPSIMPAVIGPALFAVSFISLGSSASSFTIRLLTLRMMSVTSSITPGRLAELVLGALELDVGDGRAFEDESRMRRRLLPTVVPKPRSKGSAVNLP